MDKRPYWGVFVYNFNNKQIVTFNVFDHYSFYRGCIKLAKDFSGDYEDLAEKLKREIMYYFWAKCEWEVIVSGWPPTKDRDEEIKVDVYDQIMMNWDKFFNYFVENIDWLKMEEVDS